MSKHTSRIDGQTYEQLSLFAPEASQPEPGSLDIGSRIRGAIKESLKRCPRSRHHVAADMAETLQRDITKAMLDAWTAPSHESQGHRFPAEYLPAFIAATGCTLLLETIADVCGGSFVPGPELVELELGRLATQERRLRERRKNLLSKVGKECA